MAEPVKGLQLSDFFSEADVVFDQTVRSPYHVVSTLTKLLLDNHFPALPLAPVVEAVMRRERTSPTVVGDGVVMPHARLEGLDRPCLALGIYPAGLPVEDGKPVKLVFLLLVPENQPGRYLQVLRMIAQALHEPGAVEKLASARDAEEVAHLLRRSELKLPNYVCAGDLMAPAPEALRATEPLSDALERFMSTDAQRAELPIVDDAGRLTGVVDTQALLGCFVPKGFRKLFPMRTADATDATMAHLATKLNEAHRIRVCEVMNTNVCTCLADTPAREIAADLAERNAPACYVLDSDGRLIGEISLSRFFRRILRD